MRLSCVLRSRSNYRELLIRISHFPRRSEESKPVVRTGAEQLSLVLPRNPLEGLQIYLLRSPIRRP